MNAIAVFGLTVALLTPEARLSWLCHPEPDSAAGFADLRGGPVFPFDLARYQGAKVPFLAAAPAAHAPLLRELCDER